MRIWNMDRTGLASCPVVVLGVSGVEHQGSASLVLLNLLVGWYHTNILKSFMSFNIETVFRNFIHSFIHSFTDRVTKGNTFYN